MRLLAKINGYCCKIFGLENDATFLNKFKEEWNRFCNSYKPRKRILKTPLEPSEEPLLPQQAHLAEQFGRFYEIYLKHKFIPDSKFINNLDSAFWKTIQDMHDLLSMNLYPMEKENSEDAAYNVRWRGVLLINYLLQLSNNWPRFIGLIIIKITIYLMIPTTLVCYIINTFWR